MICSPALLCERVKVASDKVPYIKQVKFYSYTKESKKELTLQEVKVAFNSIKTLPNLYENKSIYDRMSTLEKDNQDLHATVKSLWQAVESLQEKKGGPSGEPPATEQVGSKRARFVD